MAKRGGGYSSNSPLESKIFETLNLEKFWNTFSDPARSPGAGTGFNPN